MTQCSIEFELRTSFFRAICRARRCVAASSPFHGVEAGDREVPAAAVPVEPRADDDDLPVNGGHALEREGVQEDRR
jgi:hypothetical protein